MARPRREQLSRPQQAADVIGAEWRLPRVGHRGRAPVADLRHDGRIGQQRRQALRRLRRIAARLLAKQYGKRIDRAAAGRRRHRNHLPATEPSASGSSSSIKLGRQPRGSWMMSMTDDQARDDVPAVDVAVLDRQVDDALANDGAVVPAGGYGVLAGMAAIQGVMLSLVGTRCGEVLQMPGLAAGMPRRSAEDDRRAGRLRRAGGRALS